MRLLTLSLNRLELAKLQLTKPLIVIGRAPTCDVVLRAPGIKPIHFLIEWIGNGEFDPRFGQWSIIDVSKHSEIGEGLLLGPTTTKLGDISFTCSDSKLESHDEIGGRIVESLGGAKAKAPDFLEFVQVRSDSGAIEEVRHIPLRVKPKIESISKEFKEFKIEHPQMKGDQIISVLLQELPGAEISLAGRRIEDNAKLSLRAGDFLQVTWKGRDFYIRFVEAVKSPPVPRDFWGDPLLRNLTLAVFVVALLFLFLRTRFGSEPVTQTELPRVARIEIPVAPPPPVPEPVEKELPKEETKTEKTELIEEKPQEKTPPAKAGAATAVTLPKAKPKAGLNQPAAPVVKDVNQVGLLGALSKNMPKGKGISAEKVINNGLIRESVSGKDKTGIVLENPPAGVIGRGEGGAPNGQTTASLGSASTTLQGVKTANPDSKSLISRNGGTAESGLGASTNGTGTALGGKGTDANEGIGAGDFAVTGGGLDRDTVRKIIRSYGSQIRACYERSLISNTNLQGRIVYKWKILASGSVVENQSIKATLESSSLIGCVADVINHMQFPKAGNAQPTTVIYPFVFQGKS